MVGGNPARLDEAGNTMMTCATDVQESDTALGGGHPPDTGVPV